MSIQFYTRYFNVTLKKPFFCEKKTVIKTPLKKQRIKFCFDLQSFATLNCFVFSNELLCCAQFHILQDKVLPHVWLCQVQIRFHNVRACISVSRAPYGDQHPEEDMRNGVIGHSEAPVMMNHSSNERCVNYEQRNLCQHHSDQDGKISTSYIFSVVWTMICCDAVKLNIAWPLIVQTGSPGGLMMYHQIISRALQWPCHTPGNH